MAAERCGTIPLAPPWECGVMVNTSVFQTDDAGSIPVIPSKVHSSILVIVVSFIISLSSSLVRTPAFHAGNTGSNPVGDTFFEYPTKDTTGIPAVSNH